VEASAHVLGGALDRETTERELRRQALEDPLTGLGNRALLTSQLETEHVTLAAWVTASACSRTIWIGSKTSTTRSVTAWVTPCCARLAARARSCVREEDFVVRPGGDEFTIIATRTATDRAIGALAERLLSAVAEQFELEEHEVLLTASVGVAVSDRGQESAEELLRDADAVPESRPAERRRAI